MFDEPQVGAPQAPAGDPPPPPGFSPVQPADANTPPPPAGFSPVTPPAPAASRPPAGKGGTTLDSLKNTAQFVGDVASGFGGSALKTVQGGAKILDSTVPGGLNQALTGQPLAPIPAEYTEPRNTGERIGAFGEDVLEFAGGEAALKGLGFVEKIAAKSPKLLALLEKYPKASKILLSQVPVGGVQGAVKGTAEGNSTTQSGVGGAIGAGVGGAIGEKVVGPTIQKFGEAAGVLTSAEEDVMRALQSRKNDYNFLKNWELSKDRMVKEVGENDKFKDMFDAADRVRTVKQGVWDNEISPFLKQHASDDLFPHPQGFTGPMPNNPIAEAVRDRIPKDELQQANMKKFSKEVEGKAKLLESVRTVGQAETMLETMNAELQKAGYYKLSPSERAAWEKVDGFTASRVAGTKALRDRLYQYAEQNGGDDLKNTKATYGALKSMEEYMRGRANVSGRQQPISLKQAIGATVGLAHGGPLGAAAAALPIIDKIYNSPTELLNRAVKKVGQDSVSSSALEEMGRDFSKGAATSVKALAEKGAPVVGEQPLRWIRFQGGDGKEREVHMEDVPKLLQQDPDAKAVMENMSPEEVTEISQLWQDAQKNRPLPAGGGKK